MSFSVALCGTSEYLRTRLADLLREEGFSVDILDPGEAGSLFEHSLPDYDVIIVDIQQAPHLTDDVAFTSLLAARGFLFFDANPPAAGKMPPFLIHAGSSPEEIMARIHNVLYLHSGKRASIRVRLDLPLVFEWEGKTTHSKIQDISENGIFITTLAPPPDGTRISARFLLPSAPQEIVATGRAVYRILFDLEQSIISHPSAADKKIVARPGFGITFDQISDKDRQAIRDFIRTQQCH